MKKKEIQKLKEKTLFTANDISLLLNITPQTSYKIINELNEEMKKINKERKKEGLIEWIIFTHKVYKKYFSERYYGLDFLSYKKISENYDLKEYEVNEFCKNIKKELKQKGYKFVKGRIPKEYILQKLLI